ncbi:MAG: diadenylate cyclase CdaA [Bacteroidales bacterium]|nr:diadenylate cyclase CdaA [Bacteroidales bacterium]
MLFNIVHFGVTDAIDILLVSIIIYQLYKLLRGTAAVRILWTIATLFILWKLLNIFHLTMMSEILGPIISVGVIALIVVFQPEIRKFLLLLGNARLVKLFTGRFHKKNYIELYMDEINAIVRACRRMANSKTGALIVLEKETPLDESIATGERIDAIVSRELIENIFFKNSPLHDGALIIRNHRLIAARCILPVSNKEDISSDLGLRHRAAIGVTVLTDAVVIVVSEQTGNISLCREGNITYNISPLVLEKMLKDIFIEVNEPDKNR